MSASALEISLSQSVLIFHLILEDLEPGKALQQPISLPILENGDKNELGKVEFNQNPTKLWFQKNLSDFSKKNPENFKLRNLKDPKQSSKFNSNSKIHKLNLCGLCSNR